MQRLTGFAQCPHLATDGLRASIRRHHHDEDIGVSTTVKGRAVQVLRGLRGPTRRRPPDRPSRDHESRQARPGRPVEVGWRELGGELVRSHAATTGLPLKAVRRAAAEEILFEPLPERHRRSNPRVVKRKMSGFALKWARHRDWPQPTRDPAEAIELKAPLAA